MINHCDDISRKRSARPYWRFPSQTTLISGFFGFFTIAARKTNKHFYFGMQETISTSQVNYVSLQGGSITQSRPGGTKQAPPRTPHCYGTIFRYFPETRSGASINNAVCERRCVQQPRLRAIAWTNYHKRPVRSLETRLGAQTGGPRRLASSQGGGDTQNVYISVQGLTRRVGTAVCKAAPSRTNCVDYIS